MNPVLIGFVVYLAVILVVGTIAWRRTQSQAGFILGDRKLGPWVIAFSERASGESAWLLVGLPGAALALGFIELWTAIGCTTGILVSWTFVAPRLREYVGQTDSLTLPDFFRQRYPETHEAIRVVASLIIGIATAFVGLIVIIPVIGYAAWHGYLDTIDADEFPRHEIGITAMPRTETAE